MRNAA
ncbi:hypothetical protein RDI58_016648 [Solanum bulbocastanum]